MGGESDSPASENPRGALVSLQPRLESLHDLKDLQDLQDLQLRLASLLSPRWSARQQHPRNHRLPPRPRRARSIVPEESALLRLREEYQSRLIQSLLSPAVLKARLTPPLTKSYRGGQKHFL